MKKMEALVFQGLSDTALHRWAAEKFTSYTATELDAWLRRHFVYRPEYWEVLREVDWMVQDFEDFGYIEGDCDDAATFAAFVLRVLGAPARLVAIRSTHPTEFEHVFVMSGGMTFDPTVPRGTRYEILERMVLDVL